MIRPDHPDYPRPSSAAVTAAMKGNRRANTKPEALIRASLHRLGYRFRKDTIIKIDKIKPRPDIIFPQKKVAVFIDGCFWHYCPEHGHIPKSNVQYWQPKLKRNKERDRENTNALTANGWTVLRIWEHTPIKLAVSQIIRTLTAL